MKRDEQIELLAKAKERANERARAWNSKERVKVSARSAYQQIEKLRSGRQVREAKG
jgi:hypothetical protein